MKTKLLSTSIATLFLATGAAHAAETTKLPDAILGAWCGSWGWQFPDDDTAHLWRTDDVHDCANRGGIDIHPNSYDYVRFEVKTSCKINSIKFVRRGDPKKDRIRPKVYDPKTEKYVDAELTKMLPSAVYLIRATCNGLDDWFAGAKKRIWHETFEIQSSDFWITRWPLAEG